MPTPTPKQHSCKMGMSSPIKISFAWLIHCLFCRDLLSLSGHAHTLSAINFCVCRLTVLSFENLLWNGWAPRTVLSIIKTFTQYRLLYQTLLKCWGECSSRIRGIKTYPTYPHCQLHIFLFFCFSNTWKGEHEGVEESEK